MIRRSALLLSLACAAAFGLKASAAPIDDLQKSFATPPDDARIMVRWWWFGPAVTNEGIDRELKAMKDGGIGGVEVQPTYPLAVDGSPGGEGAPVKNIRWMSPEFLGLLGHTAAKAKEMGMRMDLTFGSGWPYGGPMFTQAEGTKQLDVQTVQVAAGQATVAAPAGGRGGAVVFAAFAGPAGAGGGGAAAGGGGRGGRGGGGGNGDVSGMKEVPLVNGVAQLPAGFAGGEVMFFGYRGAGLTAVKRPALGAEGPIIDHLSAKVVDKFIQLVAEPELKACGANPPFACFCDSLEVTGENWTDEMLAEFQKRRGYDLKPLLPALVGNFGPQTDQVRYDYGRTVTELYNDNFNAKFKALTAKYGSRFRVQGYGSPPAALESYAFSDLPEGEGAGAGWRGWRATRFASSASHLMNQTMTSSETFTWLHEVPFRATPLDMKAEVDSHFLDGVNQLVMHGWAYTPSSAPYPGWSFYVGGAFTDKNPWYVAMPEVSGYMQRMSAIMRAGIPANDVAVYMNDSDLWARSGPGWSSMNAAYTGLTPVLDQVLNAGFNLDGFDDGMLAMKGKAEGGTLAFGKVKYKMVVLDGPQHMALNTAKQLDEFTKGGGILIAIGGPPTIVPGFKATADDQKALAAIMEGIFNGTPKRNAMVIPNANALGAALAEKMTPDAKIEPLINLVGVEHRHTDAGEVYLVANTSNQPQKFNATFRVEDMQAEEWDGLNGKVKGLAVAAKAKGTTTVALSLAPYGSTTVVFTKRATPLAVPAAVAVAPIDLSTGWSVKFGDKTVEMATLQDWTKVPGMENFSGVASYEKKVTIGADVLKPGVGMSIQFGTPAGGPQGGGGGGRGGGGHVTANLDAPVKDAAVVFVNGQRAGAAWCPPYSVDLSDYLKAGENTIRIDVGNTATNYLAKAGWPNYDVRSLSVFGAARFGTPAANNYSQPLASGLFGSIKLEAHGK